MPALVASPLFLSLWLTPPAEAVEWFLETGGASERSEAARVEEVAVAAGFEARVVRRFVDGDGWRYLARIDGFADGDSARAAAGQLTEATGASLLVLRFDGEGVVRLGQVGSAAPEKTSGQPPVRPGAILDSVAEAHGTGTEMSAALVERPVRIAYRRTLGDGRSVAHLWGSDGEGRFLQVSPADEPTSGAQSRPIRASRTRVVGERAVLSVDGGPWQRQDVEQARAAVRALGPSELLPLVLAVGTVLDERQEFARMGVVGAGTFDGETTVVLRFGGDATTGPIDLEIGPDRRIRRIRFDDGAVIREFREYQPIVGLPGAVFPREVVTTRDGEQVDRLWIEAFEVGADMPPEWFAPIR